MRAFIPVLAIQLSYEIVDLSNMSLSVESILEESNYSLALSLAVFKAANRFS